MYSCWNTTKGTLIVYAYDFFSDLQVAALYIQIFCCIIKSDEYDQEYYLVLPYLKALTTSEIEYLTPDEKLAGTIVLFTATLILFWTFNSLFSTFMTGGICFTLDTKLKLSLFTGGTLNTPDQKNVKVKPKSSNVSNINQELIPTESLINRNELIIEQAHVESFMQFIFQWSAYFFLVYWTSLVDKTNERLYNSPEEFNMTVDIQSNEISKAVIERKNLCAN